MDADQPGADPAEFIELYGTPGTSLDGLVLVCFNGLDDVPYLEFDLSGYALNASGFFVVGSINVPNIDLEMGTNALQNGPEAIALYAAAPQQRFAGGGGLFCKEFLVAEPIFLSYRQVGRSLRRRLWGCRLLCSFWFCLLYTSPSPRD